jgi:prolipoprotein diacylglyceryltransferase
MIAETPLWMSIIWNIGPEILQLGPLSLRWPAVCARVLSGLFYRKKNV